MFVASLFFLLGTGLNAGAHNLAMLVVGRVSMMEHDWHACSYNPCPACSVRD
jgi:hypothetical protein